MLSSAMSLGVFTNNPFFEQHNFTSIIHHNNPVVPGTEVGTGTDQYCTDLNNRRIPKGIHYVPGPDECTLCVCEDGGPKWCKAVLCSPPQDCKSFRVGTSCCDFICLDDTFGGKHPGGNIRTGGPFGPVDITEVVPKVAIIAVTAMVSLFLLFFLIHRLRQRQIQGRINSGETHRRHRHSSQHCDECEDARSVDFSMDYFDRPPMSQNSRFHHPPHFFQPPPDQYFASWWKPPSTTNYSEAPPPYEEAIASTSNNLVPTFPQLPSDVPPTLVITNENVNPQEPTEVTVVDDQNRVNESTVIVEESETLVSDGMNGNPVSIAIAGPSCRIQGETVGISFPNQRNPPGYFDDIGGRREFRHSFTLPRLPHEAVSLDRMDEPFRHQRYSLQLNVLDWSNHSSSSSTLSLSTATTPTPTSPSCHRGRRARAPSPSSSSSSNSINL